MIQRIPKSRQIDLYRAMIFSCDLNDKLKKTLDGDETIFSYDCKNLFKIIIPFQRNTDGTIKITRSLIRIWQNTFIFDDEGKSHFVYTNVRFGIYEHTFDSIVWYFMNLINRYNKEKSWRKLKNNTIND